MAKCWFNLILLFLYIDLMLTYEYENVDLSFIENNSHLSKNDVESGHNGQFSYNAKSPKGLYE